MAFVRASSASGRLFRDPILSGAVARRSGLGADTAGLATTGAATGGAIGAGAAALTGAAAGSVVPVIGTAIGAVVGLVVGLLASKKDSTGLPRVPSTNQAFNNALATKWYTLYFTRYAPGGADENTATQASGISYWANQIAQDGAQRAWVNFSNSPQPVEDGVAAKAVAYAAQYGDQYTVLASAPAPSAVGAAGVPVQQASFVGGLSNGTLLLVGGGLLVGLAMMNHSRERI